MASLESSNVMTPVSTTASGTRLEFIDNLRWLMIVLVVSMHAAVTYSHLGSWYFMEDPKPGLGWTVVFATYQTFLQAFFMGLLFFIAGYFVPGGFERKGFGKFLRDRAVRLGIPSLFFMLVIQPVTVYWLLRDFADMSRPSLGQAYWPYVSSGRFLGGSGPMWFAVALLLFSFGYGIIRLLQGNSEKINRSEALPSGGQVMALAALIGLATFLVRIVQPMGTNIMNMQLCYFSQYIALFCMGILAARRKWLLRIPYAFGMRWLTAALTLGSFVWIVFIFLLVQTHSEAKLPGGFTWQSAVMCFWESFFCVGVCLGLLVLFREKFNRQGALARWLSDNSFSVYLFHTPILIAITLALRSFATPKPVKFLCATALGVIFSYLASGFVFRRIPVLKRIL
jgi:fucose 4-O-acetylase-like acetyltransferase